MKTPASIALGLLLTLSAFAAVPPVVATLEELERHIDALVVEKIDLAVPDKAEPAAALLSERFFGHPTVRKFSYVSSTEWRKKWDLLADALVKKARAQGLDAEELQRCLVRINRGRNENSIVGPRFTQRIHPSDASGETVRRMREEDAAQNRHDEEKFKNTPIEAHFNETMTFLPVAAFQARFKEGVAWVILCTWELQADDGAPGRFSHVCLWAVEPKERRIVTFAMCD